MSGPLPFSREQFFAVFAVYNEAIWPAHVAAYALGAAALAVALRRRATRTGDRFASGALAAMWLFAGSGYHLMYFSAINALAPLFAGLFIVEAAAFVFFGIVRGTLHFARPARAEAIAGVLLAVYAMLVYPLLGFWIEGTHRTLPMFGVAPCPVTIFTFALLLLTRGAVPWVVLVPPLVWAVIGGSAAVLLGVAQDWMLPVSAIVPVALLALRQLRPQVNA